MKYVDPTEDIKEAKKFLSQAQGIPNVLVKLYRKTHLDFNFNRDIAVVEGLIEAWKQLERFRIFSILFGGGLTSIGVTCIVAAIDMQESGFQPIFSLSFWAIAGVILAITGAILILICGNKRDEDANRLEEKWSRKINVSRCFVYSAHGLFSDLNVYPSLGNWHFKDEDTLRCHVQTLLKAQGIVLGLREASSSVPDDTKELRSKFVDFYCRAEEFALVKKGSMGQFFNDKQPKSAVGMA